MERIIVLGGGGHAKVVISTARACGHEVLAIFDDNPALCGQSLFGVPVLGPLLASADFAHDAAVLAIGSPQLRKRFAEELKLSWLTLVHPAAWLDSSVKIGEGTVVFAGAILQPDSIVGRHVIVNTRACVDHDCLIGDFAHLAPASALAGNVTIGTGAMLGIGASVIQGRTIGDWTTVGAGAAVVRDLPPHVTARGVPAKVTSASG